MVAMVVRAFQSRAHMWQLVRKLLNCFLSYQFVGKNVITLLLFFLCYKVVVSFNFGGNHMLLQVNRMVKTLKIE
jgi:hypothetical protein